MKSLFYSPKGRFGVDAILLLCIISALVFSDPHLAGDMHWRSSHCIICITGVGFMILHIMQHWRFIRSFTKRKVILKNKITFVVTIFSAMMILSIIPFFFGFPEKIMRFHNIIGHIFGVLIIIHIIGKAKKFVRLLKSNNKRVQVDV